MVRNVRFPPAAGRIAAAAAALTLLAGCGSTAKSPATTAEREGTCPQTAMRTLGSVLSRIYREGVKSERTGSAKHIIENSPALRQAIEAADPAAVKAAAQSLVAAGHLTDLRVTVANRTLADVGGPALTPLSGVIKGASGTPIATYRTSVWSDRGFTAEGRGVTEGLIAIRSGSRTLGNTLDLGTATLGQEGTLTLHGVRSQYFSLPGEAYPSGSVQIYLVRSISSLAPLCGADSEQTTVNTLTRIARLIYAGEVGSRTHVQIRRLEHDPALLAAVARRDPVATRAAIIGVLNQHVVRVRVLTPEGHLLSDVGGPWVLGPVGGKLRLGGRPIGSFVLSIQDDEGYLRLARRLAGLKVLMYMGGPPPRGTLVKNSLGPSPGSVPASGSYTYRGARFEVYTLNATAFPSGPLTIRVLIPIPYS